MSARPPTPILDALSLGQNWRDHRLVIHNFVGMFVWEIEREGQPVASGTATTITEAIDAGLDAMRGRETRPVRHVGQPGHS